MHRRKLDPVIAVWNVLCAVIMVGFFVYSLIIGGSAGLGYCESGQYFVSDHGVTVEVSEVVWRISYAWGIVFWVFPLLTPLAIFLSIRIRKMIDRN